MAHNQRLGYMELSKLEPLVRKPGLSVEECRHQAEQLLGRRVTRGQIQKFKSKLGLVKAHRHWVMAKEDLRRLDEMLQRHEHLVVHRGRRRLYLIPFEKALAQRARFVNNRTWEKRPANGAKHGLVSASAPHSGD